MSIRRNAKTRGFRGKPIVMLGLLSVSWVAFRFATWASLLPEGYQPALDEGTATATAAPATGGMPRPQRLQTLSPEVAKPAGSAPLVPQLPTIESASDPLDGSWNDPRYSGVSRSDIRPLAESGNDDIARLQSVAANGIGADAHVRLRMAAGHTLLAAAGFSNMELPPEIAAFFQRELRKREERAQPQDNPLLAAANLPEVAPYSVEPVAARQAGESRWSADGWLLWRDDTTTPFTSGRPSYGRSQLGAVVRYQLAPSSAHRPQVYLRGSAALQGSNEQEVAAGLSARPIAKLPVRVAAELRMSDYAQSKEVRPAAYAVTELPPQELPGGLRAEAYLQAGYVGGDFATPFVDGQARVDRSLASVGNFDLRAGASTWGGAQKDSERLDIGPTASVTFRIGETRGRVSADYRFRVAGEAEPASGPALTLSAGF